PLFLILFSLPTMSMSTIEKVKKEPLRARGGNIDGLGMRARDGVRLERAYPPIPIEIGVERSGIVVFSPLERTKKMKRKAFILPLIRRCATAARRVVRAAREEPTADRIA